MDTGARRVDDHGRSGTTLHSRFVAPSSHGGSSRSAVPVMRAFACRGSTARSANLIISTVISRSIAPQRRRLHPLAPTRELRCSDVPDPVRGERGLLCTGDPMAGTVPMGNASGRCGSSQVGRPLGDDDLLLSRPDGHGCRCGTTPSCSPTSPATARHSVTIARRHCPTNNSPTGKSQGPRRVFQFGSSHCPA